MGAHVLFLATKEYKSKRDNETRTEMEESCDFNFSIQFIQLERSQVRVQLVTGLFFLSMIDQGWFWMLFYRIHILCWQTNKAKHQKAQHNIKQYKEKTLENVGKQLTPRDTTARDP